MSRYSRKAAVISRLVKRALVLFDYVDRLPKDVRTLLESSSSRGPRRCDWLTEVARSLRRADLTLGTMQVRLGESYIEEIIELYAGKFYRGEVVKALRDNDPFQVGGDY